jgi:hypothetical protein
MGTTYWILGGLLALLIIALVAIWRFEMSEPEETYEDWINRQI